MNTLGTITVNGLLIAKKIFRKYSASNLVSHFLSKLCIFRTRMGIGTHAIDGDDIDDFQSSDPWYYLVRNIPYSVSILVMTFWIKI